MFGDYESDNVGSYGQQAQFGQSESMFGQTTANSAERRVSWGANETKATVSRAEAKREQQSAGLGGGETSGGISKDSGKQLPAGMRPYRSPPQQMSSEAVPSSPGRRGADAGVVRDRSR